MKSQKLIDELDNLLTTAAIKRKKHQKVLKTFFQQFQNEEQSIRSKLDKEKSKANRKKLERKLGRVQEAYDILRAA